MLKSLRHYGKSVSRPARLLSALAIIAFVTIIVLSNRSTEIVPQAEAVSTSVVISQVYGGGGNSGSTYTNDFIELYNRGTTTVDLTGWSVQYASAASSSPWGATPLSGTIAPGHYYLIKESQGAGGTTPLPSPEVTTGTSLMSATAGKVALMTTTTTIATGTCPTGATLVDLVGYSSTATCSETSPTGTLSNTTAAIRKNGGCQDTDVNSNDFIVSGPIPRNGSSTVNTCGGDPTQMGAVGSSSPSAVDPSSNVLLTVTVTPATNPPSTGITVTADLTSIGGSATQQFYDDGTHGDAAAGDNVFSFLAVVGATITTGAKNIPATVTDAQARTATAGITVTVASPTCGVERWSVKVGTDPDAPQVDTSKATPVTISDMRSWPAPSPSPPDNARVTPYEKTVWLINGTMTVYKKETDVDYHLVVQDGAGNTLVTEIPCPCCAVGSPFQSFIATSRQTFDARLTATTSFQTANIPVRIKGVGFFDFLHGQTGLAPNGIEVHSILDISFPTTQSAPTSAGSNVMTQVGEANINFSNVTQPGTTTVTPIDPSTAGTPPNSNYKLIGPAYDITTTATTSGPINICFSVPSITDPAAFSQLKVLHSEGGNLVDRTSGENFSSKLVCGTNIPSLSPFVVATGPGPTAANGFIGGQILDAGGQPLSGVLVSLSGTKNVRAMTDANGVYSFTDVETGGFYTLTPERANYNFSPATRSFSLNNLRADAPFTAASSTPTANPLDTTEFFVRQQYVDFLDREADQGGLDYWSAQIRACNGDGACIRQKRIDVSAAFFIEQEFQETGFFVYGLHKAAFGTRPSYSEFQLDRSRVVGGPVMEVNKTMFVNEFVEREDFKRAYPLTLSPEQFVNKLFDQAGLLFSPLEREYYISAMQNGAARSDVLRGLVETESFKQNEYNRAFVLMQYFGYLKREPEQGGYLFWLDVLNNKVQNNYRAMVCAFITSAEYQDRFSPVRTRNNGECGQ
jgi:hypothetical protein